MINLKSEKGSRKILKGNSNSLVENKLTTPWLKKKNTNRQTTVHKKLKTEQHESHQISGVISVSPER